MGVLPGGSCLVCFKGKGVARKYSTTAGSSDETGQVQWDVAHNFSQDRASLHLHPRSKKINGLAKMADDNVHLDTNQFWPDLAPPVPKTAVPPNTLWRANSLVVKHEKYLDTTCAFAKGINMVGRVEVTL